MSALTPATNWAGNVVFGPQRVVAPRDVSELCSAVGAASAAGDHVNTVGTGHSFSDIADTDGLLVSTEHLREIGPIDDAAGTVSIQSGVRFAELGDWLHTRGWSLHNLPSLPHITVAGAAATATHGSGVHNGNVATTVTALDLVVADGNVRHLDERDPAFSGAVVVLGALGVVARLDVRIRPSLEISQRVWTGAALAAVREQFDDLMGCAYSVSLFTDWQDDTIDQIWVKSTHGIAATETSGLDLSEFGATEATADLHPVGGDAASCTEQRGRGGPAHERLPHFRSGFVPSFGAELQSEYFVDSRDAVAAIDAIRSIAERLAPVLLISEIRGVAADDLWLSTATGRDSVAFHFTWRLDPVGVADVLPVLEDVLEPFAPRPHWGKITTMDAPRIRDRYPRMADFAALRGELDPGEVFRNRALEVLLG